MEQRLCTVIGLAPVETRGPDTAGGVALFFCPSADFNEDQLFWAEVLYVERIVSRASEGHTSSRLDRLVL